MSTFGIISTYGATCEFGFLGFAGLFPLPLEVCQPDFFGPGSSFFPTCNHEEDENFAIGFIFEDSDTCNESEATYVGADFAIITDCDAFSMIDQDPYTCGITELRITRFENSNCTGDVEFVQPILLSDSAIGCNIVSNNAFFGEIITISISYDNINGYSAKLYENDDCSDTAERVFELPGGCEFGTLFEFIPIGSESPTEEPTEEPQNI